MYAQLLDDQTQKDFWVFYLFQEVIFVTLVLKVFLKMSNFLCWKTLCLAILRLLSQVVPNREILKKFQFLKNFKQSFVSPSWVVHDSNLTHKNMPSAFAHFVSRLATGLRVTNSWNAKKKKIVFKDTKFLFSKYFIFSHSVTPTVQNSSKPSWISTLRLLQGISLLS